MIDWSRFPCALGDVIVRASDAGEAWLAGAIVLSEEAEVAALFVAPEAGGDRAVYARAKPSDELAWLAPAPASLVVGREPPSAIELDGTRFERVRRLPLAVERAGAGAPEIGATAILGEYATSAGDVAIVLVGDAATHAWRGIKLARQDYDVWRGK